VQAREHAGSIFTLTHDPANDAIITTGRDGKMVAWTPGMYAVRIEEDKEIEYIL